MKRIICSICFFLCGLNVCADGCAQVLEYHVKENSYAVVVPIDCMSVEQAQNLGKQRAARMALDQGHRYISIDSEQKVFAITANPPQYFPADNMYQRLIIEGNFSRDQAPRYSSQLTPAIRMVFTIY